jgi:hypothetical protein
MTIKKKTVRAQPNPLAVTVAKRRAVSRPKAPLYEQDFNKWINQQVALLKKGDIDQVDMANLIEEMESLGKNDRRALKSQLTRLLMHLLKQEYQPEKQTDSHSWTNSIVEAERAIKYLLEDSPSLKNELKNMLESSYEDARQDAAKETGLGINKFPKECPYKLEKLLPFIKKK